MLLFKFCVLRLRSSSFLTALWTTLRSGGGRSLPCWKAHGGWRLCVEVCRTRSTRPPSRSVRAELNLTSLSVRSINSRFDQRILSNETHRIDLTKYKVNVPQPPAVSPFLRQPLSPSSQRRLKQLTDKHGSGKIYQMMASVVGSRDLDLNLTKGELVAVISEADSRGDRRRWLVDAGGKNQRPSAGETA